MAQPSDLAIRAHHGLALSKCLAKVSARRTMQGPQRPSWNFATEVMVELMREEFKRAPSMPITQWRYEQDLFARNALYRKEPTQTILIKDIVCDWVLPNGQEDLPVLIYLHGGGYTIGSMYTHGPLVHRLARRANRKILFPYYRLAPEHPYPTAIEDSVLVYQWLLEQNVSPKDIVIGGDSAGGGLTMATFLALRDRQIPLPAGGMLLSPWVDATASLPSTWANEGQDWLMRSGVEFYGSHYISEDQRKDPLVSPLFADLTGLPKLLIQVGDAELLRDEAIALGEKATAAGVQADVRVWPDMIHSWQLMSPMIPQAAGAIDELAEFLKNS